MSVKGVQDAEVDDGWSSLRCTKCRKALDYGAGNQFLDVSGRQQRYCWADWVKYNNDPRVFPGVKEGP